MRRQNNKHKLYNCPIPISSDPMPKDNFLEEMMETPEKRIKLYQWILWAQIISIVLIVVGGIVFILWALDIF